jgi:ADP-ribose pyrophosphatase YjhB (NUDIX family)
MFAFWIAFLCYAITNMSNLDQPLTPREFTDIYAKVPRLTIEIVMRNPQGEVLLAKRAIEPCIGQWHLPGGTVRFAEPLAKAVKRIAAREIGISVEATTLLGIIEYPSHYMHGLDDPVGIAYEITNYGGTIAIDTEASTYGWFDVLPDPMHADQDSFLIEKGIIKKLRAGN